jgi:hypothetical protein
MHSSALTWRPEHRTFAAMASAFPSTDPLRDTVRWLATHTRFPASRLESRAETMLCMAVLATAEEADERERHLVKSSDPALMSAHRTMANRRKQVHFKCDNSAKV